MLRSMMGLAALALMACASTTQTYGAPASTTSSAAPSVRLYTLDCGRIEISDIGFFTDAGKPIGKPKTLSVPCFVVRHPKGILVWDTGLDEAIGTAGNKNPVGAEYVDHSVHEQLTAIGVAPKDVTYVAFSHLHADHAGNANLFPTSTWLVGKAELPWATATPAPLGVDAKVFSAYRTAHVEPLEGDRDVFGDGSVRILQTPGHTPGHQSLQLTLAHAGTVVLSGDLAHSRENWEKHVVPAFNASKDQTLASMDRVGKIVNETHARFIVQHEPDDVKTLPKAPAFLD